MKYEVGRWYASKALHLFPLTKIDEHFEHDVLAWFEIFIVSATDHVQIVVDNHRGVSPATIGYDTTLLDLFPLVARHIKILGNIEPSFVRAHTTEHVYFVVGMFGQ